MGFAEVLLLGVGLSMDAFAVAVGKGLGMRRLSLAQAAVIALFFGGFQALMPVLGWLVGAQLNEMLNAVGAAVAFVLLAFIGGKMIWDAARDGEGAARGTDEGGSGLDLSELLMLAVATSIDALAAGVALALLDVNIAFAAALIGATTFALSLAGVLVGHQFGSRWERPATFIGGLVLIGIGLKTLLESLLG